ncbi:MAG TPA: nucleotidyl transferase AbiEii/AbiGii toxin family protein [Conexibacter sp.]|nr:nucleotidyl transferase AbiEii/AbiGii toxin family protein [Conexibacter sp.]
MTGFGQILSDLNRAGIRYVLVGGIALIRHGVARATRDIDAVLEPGEENLDRLRTLIAEWGATRPDGSPIPVESITEGKTIHLATPHGALDLLPDRTAPLSFAELMDRADVRRVDGVEAPICSLADLVALKRIASRGRDLADLSELEAAHGELPDSRENESR